MIAIPTWVRQNLSVILICISFIAREVEHSFVYLLAICALPLKVPYSVHVCIFLHWVVDSLGVEFFELPVDSGY
jgi:hypothetical protein